MAYLEYPLLVYKGGDLSGDCRSVQNIVEEHAAAEDGFIRFVHPALKAAKPAPEPDPEPVDHAPEPEVQEREPVQPPKRGRRKGE